MSLPLSRNPSIADRGLCSPSGSGRIPAVERILVHFRHKFATFECLTDEEFPVFVLHEKNLRTIENSAFPLGLVFQ